MNHIPSLYIAYNDFGRGMYTGLPINPGDIIEVCPLILVPEAEKEQIHQSKLHDYYFLWPPGGIAIALGYGSLYNHSKTPNAKVIYDIENEEIIIECTLTINPGDEILIDYTDGTDEVRLWF